MFNSFLEFFEKPGPDGTHALSYHKYWHIIGKNSTLIVRPFLEHGHILREINELTYIDP